jgi:Na+-translocating ferredoxin:NAD+ oxidoreductase RnfC subunit
MSLVDQIKNAGVVGAGGAGFPAHVKMAANVEWLLANGAECEPLMHKDREVMKHFAAEIIEGLKLSAQSVQADKVAIGIKSKNKDAISALRDKAGDIQIHEFGDYYPAGDEYEVVAAITRRLMPPGGIPLDVGAVVSNVESLYNIYQASQGKPVTSKFLTIAGMVKEPVTLQIPVGTTFEQAIEFAGGVTISSYAVMEGGLMMGKPVHDLKKPVTKKTGGLVVLPAEHRLIHRYTKPDKEMHKIGHSACDQCSYCTELCPRYLLGYDIQPHLVMRSLGFSMAGDDLWNQYAMLCCHCGICTLYACPEELYPREACERSIDHMREQGVTKWQGPTEVQIHPMKDARRVPMKMLMNRLGVTKYEAHAGYREMDYDAERVFIPLLQHVGVPAQPVVKEGEQVEAGQCIADIPDGQLGARVHSSISGRVREITDDLIVIEA